MNFPLFMPKEERKKLLRIFEASNCFRKLGAKNPHIP